MLRSTIAAGAVSLMITAIGAPRPAPPTKPSLPVAGLARAWSAADARPRRALRAPVILERSAANTPVKISGTGRLSYNAEGPSTVHLANLPREPRGRSLAAANAAYVRGGKRIESPFSDEQVGAAVERAKEQGQTSGVQPLAEADDRHSRHFVGRGPRLKRSWDAIDAGDCCEDTGFAAFVPPDPDIAVGPRHIIAVVNTSFEIYDKRGNVLVPAVQFSVFFDGTPGCTAYAEIPGFPGLFGATFDPDVVYDEKADRFVIGIDGNTTDYCVAATKTSDPTEEWHRYGFPTNINGAIFDFPHMGIGKDAVFMGSNQFGGTVPGGFEGRVFAMHKRDMYRGRPLRVVTRVVKPDDGLPNLRFDGTPQPAQFQVEGDDDDRRGKNDKNDSDRHYIMTEFFDGKVHSVYAWEDPFGDDEFYLVGDVDLAAASGVPCEAFSCFPVDWPQAGSVEILTANDYRGQETKFRHGSLWTTQNISCNPGEGTVNCIRWAELDPRRVRPGVFDPVTFVLTAGTRGVRQAGVFASDGEHRTFPSLAVNRCEDMAIGYSIGGQDIFPSIAVTGRRWFDPRGRVRREVSLKEGEVPYTSFQDDGGQTAERWGDYSGMAIDPNGKTFWYIGEYSRDNSVANPFAGWGTFIGSFEFSCSGRDRDD